MYLLVLNILSIVVIQCSFASTEAQTCCFSLKGEEGNTPYFGCDYSGIGKEIYMGNKFL